MSGLSVAIEYVVGPAGWLATESMSSSHPTVLQIAALARRLFAGTCRAEVEVSALMVP